MSIDWNVPAAPSATDGPYLPGNPVLSLRSRRAIVASAGYSPVRDVCRPPTPFGKPRARRLARRVRFGVLERVRFDVMPLDVTSTRANFTADGQPARLAESVPDPHAGTFETAYADTWLPVFRFALAWTNDWSAAEDLAQEAFLRLWGRRAEIDWSVSVLPWLLVTTRRSATDRFRRLRRALSLRAPTDVGAGPDARLEWLDLRESFRTLSSLERSALVLTAIEDLNATEAGAILGIEANAVRSAASRGRRKLKERR